MSYLDGFQILHECKLNVIFATWVDRVGYAGRQVFAQRAAVRWKLMSDHADDSSPDSWAFQPGGKVVQRKYHLFWFETQKRLQKSAPKRKRLLQESPEDL